MEDLKDYEETLSEEDELTDEEIAQMLEEGGEDSFTGESISLDELSEGEQQKVKEWQKKYTQKRQREKAELQKMQEYLQKLEGRLSTLEQSQETEDYESEEDVEEDEVSSLVDAKVNERFAEIQAQAELEQARKTLPFFTQVEPQIAKILEKNDMPYEDAYWIAMKPYILGVLEQQSSQKKAENKEFFVESAGSGAEPDSEDKKIVEQIINAEKNANKL